MARTNANRTVSERSEDADQPGAAMRLATCLFPDETDPDLKDHSGNANDPNWRILLGRCCWSIMPVEVLRIINDTLAQHL